MWSYYIISDDARLALSVRPALHANTCKGRLPHIAANFFTLLKSDRSSSQISINSLIFINFLALSAFSIDLQAITIFHSFVLDRALTAAKPIPRFAPVTMTVLLFTALVAAAEVKIELPVSSRISAQQIRIAIIIVTGIGV